MDSQKIEYCSKCVTPDSRPRIVFNTEGVCNACLNAEAKKKIDWKSRNEELIDLLKRYKSKDGSWDCIVPWSGGKDSSSIAWRLKYEYGMNPLLVTFSPIIPNEVGRYNRESMIKAGFDHLFFRPNQKVHQILAKRFLIERGNPKVAWDSGINTIPVQVAVKYKIKLIFYAEHGESEYGGKVLSEESKKIRNFTEIVEHIVGDDPRNWEMEDVSVGDLNPYIYPSKEQIQELDIKALYYTYFHKWSMFENYKYIKEKIDFKESDERTCGTFTNFDSLDDKIDDLYYYLQYIKFGFGRCVRDTSRFIHNDHMKREEALELCRKYDGEFPKKWLPDVLDYLKMSKAELLEVVDKHRNSEIWKKTNEKNFDGNWSLRFPIV